MGLYTYGLNIHHHFLEAKANAWCLNYLASIGLTCYRTPETLGRLKLLSTIYFSALLIYLLRIFVTSFTCILI